MQLERQLRPEAYGGGEAATSAVDERGVAQTAMPRSDQDDRHLQEPQSPTPTSKNTTGTSFA